MVSEQKRIEGVLIVLVAKPLSWLVYGLWVAGRQSVRAVARWSALLGRRWSSRARERMLTVRD